MEKKYNPYYLEKQTVDLLGSKKPETLTVRQSTKMGDFGTVRVLGDTYPVMRLHGDTWKEYRNY